MAATRKKATPAEEAPAAAPAVGEKPAARAPRKRAAKAESGAEAAHAPVAATPRKKTAKARASAPAEATPSGATPADAVPDVAPAQAVLENAPSGDGPGVPAAAPAKAPRKRTAARSAAAAPATSAASTAPAPAFRSDGGAAFPDTQYAVVERILAGFVAAEVRKVGVGRVVLGLSGGIDSAVAAAVAARALGPANVLGVMMPYQSSSPESLADAREVAASLGIETEVVDITPQVDAYFGRFPDASRLRRGNKMARERMTILYDFSAARSALVVGTSNKTELLLGYGTLYGDMASALNPIGDLYKTQVWGLARHMGLPSAVIDKPPTADLWSGQTDEVELGFSYHDVDRLLVRMIDERCRPEELVEMGFDPVFVDRVGRMVRSSQFKRRLPLIAKLSPRSIDTDFRYSRDWGL